MTTCTRRQFLAGAAAAGAAALSAGRSLAAGPPAKVKSGTDIVTLGRSGIRTSVLGVGTGTHGGREQRLLGPDGFARLWRHAYERGIRYIDTADNYRMHGYVRRAIQGLPRDQLFIQTKTPAKQAADAKADIERFRVELDVDYLDTVLMHAMGKGGYTQEMRPVMDVLFEAKQKGRVRAVGVSCHGYPPLETSAGCDWTDVHLVRVNPFGDMMDDVPERVAAQIRKMKERNHGVIGMKIYGETGFDSREKRLQSLKYVLGLGTVDAFTIGFTSTQQIDETLQLIAEALA